MTRSEEFDWGNVVLSTQRRKLWRTWSRQAHTYRTGNKFEGKGEVVIGCSSWSWVFDVFCEAALVEASSLDDKPLRFGLSLARDNVLRMCSRVSSYSRRPRATFSFLRIP